MSDNRITIDHATWQRLQEDPSQLLEFRLGGEAVGMARVVEMRSETLLHQATTYSISIAQVDQPRGVHWRRGGGDPVGSILNIEDDGEHVDVTMRVHGYVADRIRDGIDRKFVLQPAAFTHNAEQVAEAFHQVYERLAPAHHYETREASAKPWAEVPENNRALMVATVQALIDDGVIVAVGSAMPDTDWRTASGQDLRDIAEAAGVDIMPGATDAELRRAFEALKELEAQESAHPGIFCPWLRRPSWEERRPEDGDYILPNADAAHEPSHATEDLPGWEYMSTSGTLPLAPMGWMHNDEYDVGFQDEQRWRRWSDEAICQKEAMAVGGCFPKSCPTCGLGGTCARGELHKVAPTLGEIRVALQWMDSQEEEYATVERLPREGQRIIATRFGRQYSGRVFEVSRTADGVHVLLEDPQPLTKEPT